MHQTLCFTYCLSDIMKWATQFLQNIQKMGKQMTKNIAPFHEMVMSVGYFMKWAILWKGNIYNLIQVHELDSLWHMD